MGKGNKKQDTERINQPESPLTETRSLTSDARMDPPIQELNLLSMELLQAMSFSLMLCKHRQPWVWEEQIRLRQTERRNAPAALSETVLCWVSRWSPAGACFLPSRSRCRTDPKHTHTHTYAQRTQSFCCCWTHRNWSVRSHRPDVDVAHADAGGDDVSDAQHGVSWQTLRRAARGQRHTPRLCSYIQTLQFHDHRHALQSSHCLGLNLHDDFSICLF